MSKSSSNKYLPFVDLFKLERIDDKTFRSTASPFTAGSTGRAYGGHVYAQAAWAAAQTVTKGFIIHVCWVIKYLVSSAFRL